MATTADYLTQLQTDKQTLVDNLVAKGVEATSDETFTTLCPKVANIPSGSNIEINDARYLFQSNYRESSAQEIIDNILKNVINTASMFNQFSSKSTYPINLSNFDTSKSTDFSYMFNNANGTYITGIENLDTSSNKTFYGTFYNFRGRNLNLSNYNTSNVNYMNSCFDGYKGTELIIDGWNTSNVTNIGNMLRKMPNVRKLNLSSFDTSKITDTQYLFYNDTSLDTLIIDRQDVFKLTQSADNIFYGTPILAGAGYVYVADNMVDTYKSATNWSGIADQIRPISEYVEV